MTKVLWQPIVCAETGEISDIGYEMVLHCGYIPKIVSSPVRRGHLLRVHIQRPQQQDQPWASSARRVRSWLIGFDYKGRRHVCTWALEHPLLKMLNVLDDWHTWGSSLRNAARYIAVYCDGLASGMVLVVEYRGIFSAYTYSNHKYCRWGRDHSVKRSIHTLPGSCKNVYANTRMWFRSAMYRLKVKSTKGHDRLDCFQNRLISSPKVRP